MNIKEYVGQYGYKVSDLSDEFLKKVKEELDFVNKGGVVIDGVMNNVEFKKGD